MPAPGRENKRKLWKAGDLSRATGLTRQALHQYVQMRLIKPVVTTKGGQRLFDPSAVGRIEIVRKLSAIGYTLHEIRGTFKRARL